MSPSEYKEALKLSHGMGILDSEGVEGPSSGSIQETREWSKIRTLLIFHLGSEAAADAWLNASANGYPTTALDAIHSGHADLVLEDIETHWGPSPSYA